MTEDECLAVVRGCLDYIIDNSGDARPEKVAALFATALGELLARCDDVDLAVATILPAIEREARLRARRSHTEH